jgi:hypothetical protein
LNVRPELKVTEALLDEEAKSRRPSPAELLATPGAHMHRTDFRNLGFERRAIDVIFRECPNVKLPGYSRPYVVSDDVRALLDGCTYCDRCGDRVRPT